ncbi:ROK family transcriptional regulator [Pseudarthrobacter sp. AL07]|uniref:ROK family transcriptional regulator n=1 Tax=unclassified Pseudarthrobacter TaxID=2647000 RepID=UPI00249C8E81|nr:MULTISPECIES: ROK family transcriptional regulator [unclassified Pseudarthrobacter]MDI3193654.1 ROK family transcriptional regulator [Pseudarthrobacter sp. AL20]MDI3207836.1 ROK family transcriptional regulator [Pseudarthrobacter sp. AL07]
MTEISVATPQLLRRVSAGAVLDFMRASEAVTVTEVMEATGLTRATAIAVCEDLMQRGWIRELENQRAFGGYQKGRPARRFELSERAGYVLGMDVGVSKATVVVSDLRGKAIGRASQPFAEAEIPAEERIAVIDRTAMMALHGVGASPDSVLAVCAGVAAPVDRNGEVLVTQHFWGLFDVDLKAALRDRRGWTVLLENDANLAALGDRWRGAAVGVDDVVVILASERLGSGVIDGGRLLHGRGGGAGELAFLDMVEGVGDTYGIAALARTWAAVALAGKAKTSLRDFAAEGVEAEQVFAAAANGDAVARAILERLADRMARVIGAVSTIINPELVVIGGAVAKSAGVLLGPIAERLKEYTVTPARVAVSPLGDSIVTVGAVRCALDYVEKNTLDLELAVPA